ncbi:hypothetical protein [Pseudomonas citronellolis]|uniref:hypothetical protein n=1 Tax=Pseudomonas citronellolis TaxID=53408 RepID=UPI00248DDA26|nr:hypothetical protein [Pseudomonas citronellolis]
MLNKTALKSPVFLARVKAAVARAVRHSYSPERRALGIGHAVVRAKRTGRLSLVVVARQGRGLEFFDGADRDITADVLAALQAFHAEMREAAKVPAAADDDRGIESFPYGREALGQWQRCAA